MKKIFILLLLPLFAFSTLWAQTNTVELCTEQDIAASLRPKYMKQAELFLQGYYGGLLLNIHNEVIQETFIEKHMVAETLRYKPEYQLSIHKHGQYLSPEQYMQELDKSFTTFRLEELSLEADNIHIEEEFYKVGMASCYLIVHYDLSLKENENILFKRRCTAYCLFPNAMAYIDVRLMQVEPVKELVAYQEFKDEKRIVFEENGKKGLLYSPSDKIAIPAIYDSLYDYTSEGNCIIVGKDDKFGIINIQREELVPCVYNYIDYTCWKEFVYAEKDKRCGYISLKTYQEAIPLKYDRISQLHDGYAIVQSDDKLGIVDSTGKEIVPCKYVGISNYLVNFKETDNNIFSEGLVPLYIVEGKKLIYRTKIGFANNEGEIVIPFEYTDIEYGGFSEGLCAVSKKPFKWGFINRQGEETIPFKYNEARGFSDGLAAVRKSGEWGFINKQGQVVIPFIYEDVFGRFIRGSVRVKKDGKWGTIDTAGKVLKPFIDDNIY